MRMRFRSKHLLTIITIILLVVACTASPTEDSGSGRVDNMAYASEAPSQFIPEPDMEFHGGETIAPRSPRAMDQPSIAIDRLIVQNVWMALLTESVTNTIDNISSMATEMQGFVISSHIGGDEGKEYGSVSFRVPAKKTDEARSNLRNMAIRVTEESSQSQDVTEEYSDLQGRLENLSHTEEQYILLFEKAKSVEDMLKIQNELSIVQGQIEQVMGRIQYLERTSAMSLISVTIRDATSEEPIVAPGWSFQETFKDAFRSIARFGQLMAGSAIWIVIYSPVWASLLVLSYLCIKWIIRRTNNSG